MSKSWPSPPSILDVPILTAPTAAGKSVLALELAHHFPLEIVAADAFTVYRGLDIGTAKPTPSERQSVPHHLLDVAEVTEDFDVARYVGLAETAIADILARGKIPLVVGGTGFYLSGLIRGLPQTPPADLVVRAQLETELAERGLAALLGEIEQLNPAEAARMERNPRRVIRALEVYRRTGRFPGEFGYSVPRFSYRVFAFACRQSELETRIVNRTQLMLKAGWPQEAAWLAQQVGQERLPRPTVWQALGYREALALAQGQCTPDEAAQAIALATRQYAKRQLTWLRGTLRATVLDRAQVQAELSAFLSSEKAEGKEDDG